MLNSFNNNMSAVAFSSNQEYKRPTPRLGQTGGSKPILATRVPTRQSAKSGNKRPTIKKASTSDEIMQDSNQKQQQHLQKLQSTASQNTMTNMLSTPKQ